MGWAERKSLYKAIEEYRKKPLVVYVTSTREGADGAMASDALPAFIEQLDALPPGTEDIDLLIGSYGGDPMVAWRAMSLIRARDLKVSVLIPHSAYSAATLLALGADSIVMHPNGHLGPVDMQIRRPHDGQMKRFSTEDVSAYLDFVRETLRITDQEHVRSLFELTCKEVGSLGIGFSARSSKLAVDLAGRLLGMHMKDDESRVKIPSIIENMSRKFQSHSYPVSRDEAKGLRLPINDPDKELEKLMWAAWVKIDGDLLQRVPFDAVAELAKSAEAPKLFSPVLQLDIPAAAAMIPSFQTTWADLQSATKVSVNPVEFAVTTALVESLRSGSGLQIRGKIFAYRSPDMTIQHNLVITSNGWQTHGAPS